MQRRSPSPEGWSAHPLCASHVASSRAAFGLSRLWTSVYSAAACKLAGDSFPTSLSLSDSCLAHTKETVLRCYYSMLPHNKWESNSKQKLKSSHTINSNRLYPYMSRRGVVDYISPSVGLRSTRLASLVWIDLNNKQTQKQH